MDAGARRSMSTPSTLLSALPIGDRAPVERNGTLIPTGVAFSGNIKTAPAITTTRIAARSLFENSSGQAEPVVLFEVQGRRQRAETWQHSRQYRSCSGSGAR